MAGQVSADERMARRMIADDRAIAVKLAEQQAVQYGKTVATPDEEDDLYWYRDDQVDEHALRSQPNPQTGQPYTEAEIAYTVYPKRRKLVYTGTRALDLKERIAYVEKMNARRASRLAAEAEQED